eukprot:gene3502-2453_t
MERLLSKCHLNRKTPLPQDHNHQVPQTLRTNANYKSRNRSNNHKPSAHGYMETLNYDSSSSKQHCMTRTRNSAYIIPTLHWLCSHTIHNYRKYHSTDHNLKVINLHVYVYLNSSHHQPHNPNLNGTHTQLKTRNTKMVQHPKTQATLINELLSTKPTHPPKSKYQNLIHTISLNLSIVNRSPNSPEAHVTPHHSIHKSYNCSQHTSTNLKTWAYTSKPPTNTNHKEYVHLKAKFSLTTYPQNSTCTQNNKANRSRNRLYRTQNLAARHSVSPEAKFSAPHKILSASASTPKSNCITPNHPKISYLTHTKTPKPRQSAQHSTKTRSNPCLQRTLQSLTTSGALNPKHGSTRLTQSQIVECHLSGQNTNTPNPQQRAATALWEAETLSVTPITPQPTSNPACALTKHAPCIHRYKQNIKIPNGNYLPVSKPPSSTQLMQIQLQQSEEAYKQQLNAWHNNYVKQTLNYSKPCRHLNAIKSTNPNANQQALYAKNQRQQQPTHAPTIHLKYTTPKKATLCPTSTAKLQKQQLTLRVKPSKHRRATPATTNTLQCQLQNPPNIQLCKLPLHDKQPETC